MIFDFDQLHEVLQTLGRNRLRTLLTACGIFWGVFMMVLMLGTGRGFEKAIEDDVGYFAVNSLSFSGQVTTQPYLGHQAGRPIQLTIDDVEALSGIPGVEVAMPRLQLAAIRPGHRTRHGDKTMDAHVLGDYPDIQRTESSVTIAGRFLVPDDVTEARKVAVIGTQVRESLFGTEYPIGKSLQIGSTPFQVVGVQDAATVSGPRREWMQSRIFVPWTTLARTFGAGRKVSSIPMLATHERPIDELEAEATAILKARHHVAPGDPGGIFGFNRERFFRKFVLLFGAIRTLCWTVGIFTLLAGAIGVSNIMMIAVAERTREIAVRKAIGAPPASIVRQIVLESMLLTALAGYLGLVTGVAVLEAVAHVMRSMPANGAPSFFSAPELPFGRALIATLVLTVCGSISGLTPARAALAVRPAEALAHE